MRKFVGFCLVFLLSGMTLIHSQARIIQSQEMRCVSAYANNVNYAPNIRGVTLNQYSDDSFQFAIYYRDNTPTEYLYLRNGRQQGAGMLYNADMSSSDGQRYFNLTGEVIARGNLIDVFIRQGNMTILSLTLQ